MTECRKIIVGGCSSCPYCKDIKVKGQYHFKCVGFTSWIANVFWWEHYKHTKGRNGLFLIIDDYIGAGDEFPEWCPLPKETDMTEDEFEEMRRVLSSPGIRRSLPRVWRLVLDQMEKTGCIYKDPSHSTQEDVK